MEGDQGSPGSGPGHPISIHTLRMEGDVEKNEENLVTLKISIHTLRMEGDLVGLFIVVLLSISIHTLRMEGDRSGLTLGVFS